MALIAPLAAFPEGSEARGGRELLELRDLLPDSTLIHPDIARSVEVDLSAVGPVAENLSLARTDLLDASAREQSALARGGSLEVAERLASSELRLARSAEGMARVRAVGAETDLGAFAVDSFVAGEQDSFEELQMNGSVDPRDTLVGDVGRRLRDRYDLAAAHLEATVAEGHRLESELGEIAERRAEVQTARMDAVADSVDAQGRIDRFGPAFEKALLTAPVEGLDFPVVVLDAYYRAELTMASDRPECQVHWYQLAAIGRVESGHGTFGRSSVGPEGTTSVRILGPVLDGTRFASIPDTDGGLHDADAVWDRAVGPMEFLPGSWRIFGRDGDGDEVADPHNLYDAALAAAEHLCRSHRGLDRPERYREALFGYNHSVVYGRTVMGFADGYRTAVRLDPGDDSIRALVRSPGR